MTRHPVLLIAFNRPSKTRMVLEKIRLAAPKRLYVAVDGPRPHAPDDDALCGQVRDLISFVDWPCRIETLFREDNLGCGRGASEAISWFFANEDAGIILEDDILPTRSFFAFCDAMLDKYKDNEQISMIAGSCFAPSRLFEGFSYKFSAFPLIWGWASWKRAWRHYDYEMRTWPNWDRAAGLANLSRGDRFFENHWRDVFERMYRSHNKVTWDYQWLFKNFECNFKTIVPRNSIVSNIGFDIGATHAGKAPWYVRKYGASELHFPVTHPSACEVDPRLDRYMHRNIFNVSFAHKTKIYLKTAASLGFFQHSRVDVESCHE
ncbi:hypothetical protein [Methylosinus sp. Sm6]|uniref:hypothetical protein n=1 Tax=Methylosinus sp. Sm6 TaxID=2866948 RepID=UPI001C991013|nr:hypothetical protein [Methylosinus sp. Sm6]MBY6243403.1 hypothetical protein [Methylosinus sp. Sm6]